MCGKLDKGEVCILTEIDNKSNQYTDFICKKWKHSGKTSSHSIIYKPDRLEIRASAESKVTGVKTGLVSLLAD